MIRNKELTVCSGFCRLCQTDHILPSASAMKQAHHVIAALETYQSIGFSEEDRNDPNVSTNFLFGEQRGKMFGLLECQTRDGKPVWLFAFSGQYNGRWQIPGWVEPLFNVLTFQQINAPVEAQIKELGRQISAAESRSQSTKQLRDQRTLLSQQLMKKLHALYELNNFRGISASLSEVLGSEANKPTGIGDCCAPKLLNHAARNDLIPLSLAEFYFGRENRSLSRHHAHFYPPCTDKCKPLLGFLLCGAASDR